MRQDELFTTKSLLPGFLYEPEFVDRGEEAELVRLIQSLPLEEARYREFTARRRIVSYGASYDFSSHELHVAGAIPPALHPLRSRMAELMGVLPESIRHALIAEYQPGSPLGWHRDVPESLPPVRAIHGRCLDQALRHSLQSRQVEHHVGPEAGEKGGRILYSGPPAGLAGLQASRTAQYLWRERSRDLADPGQHRRRQRRRELLLPG